MSNTAKDNLKPVTEQTTDIMTRKRSGSREGSLDRRNANRRGRDRSVERNERDRKRYLKVLKALSSICIDKTYVKVG